jgi:Lysylphosphatidylglycerol synthase TM region
MLARLTTSSSNAMVGGEMRRVWSSAWLRWSVSVLGLALIVLLVRQVSIDALRDVVFQLAPVLPLVVLGDLLRVLCEVCATKAALRTGVPGPFKRLFWVHLASYGVGCVFPAPRPMAEAVKASVLKDVIGLPAAVTIGVVLQTGTLLVVGGASLLYGLTLGGSPFRLALCANGALALSGYALLSWGMRSRTVARLLLRARPKARASIARLRHAAQQGQVMRASFWLALSVCVRLSIQLTLLAKLGVFSLRLAMLADGLRLLGATVFIFVPGQVGAREAWFSYAAKSEGLGLAQASALALGARLSELLVASAGLLVLARLRRRRAP